MNSIVNGIHAVPQLGVQRQKKQCKLCMHDDCDVDILSCGCSFHARCLPTNIFRSSTKYQPGHQQDLPNKNSPCPSCGQSIKDIFLYPLSMNYLEQASRYNLNCLGKTDASTSSKLDEASVCRSSSHRQSGAGFVRKRQDYESESAETVTAKVGPYLVWSKTAIECSDNDKLHFRTGRWNNAETKYVDSLTSKFDSCALNLPHGIKLNEFLRDMLMCKSSRLTKKFKNAKLSTKLYQGTVSNSSGEDPQAAAEFARQQQNFVNSLSEVTRLIVQFNMSRMWRQHLFNTCLQNGYDNLKTEEWVQSLDDFEKKVSESEDRLKRVRRRRLEIAFKEDSMLMKRRNSMVTNDNSGFIKESQSALPLTVHEGTPVQDAVVPKVVSSMFEIPDLAPLVQAKVDTTPTAEPTPIDQLKVKAMEQKSRPNIPSEILSPITTASDDDFSFDFLDFDCMNEKKDIYPHDSEGETDSEESMAPLLSTIIGSIQKQDLPFHCIDIWVPGGISQEQCTDIGIQNRISSSKRELEVVYAGGEARSDLLPLTKLQLNEFGVYSKNFMFDGGAGMPGRVYTSGRHSWEPKIQDSDIEHFRRVAGAKMCNIRTAVGIPLKMPNSVRAVVGFYSLFDLKEDQTLVRNLTLLCQDLVKPERVRSKSIPSSINTAMSNVVSKVSMDDIHGSIDSVASQASDLTSSSNTGKYEVLSENDVNVLANLLAAHMPIAQSNEVNQTRESSLENFIALRMVLLRYPSSCDEEQKRRLQILKKSYDGYVRVMMNENDLANMLVKDWVHLNEHVMKSLPWGVSISHVNYSGSEAANISPHTKICMLGPSLSSSSLPLKPPPVPSSEGFV